MGRTADSYLKESGTTPIEMLYPFVEWTDDQLNTELERTWLEQTSVKHGEERTAQLGRRILHLITEMNFRIQEELQDGQ